MKWKIRKKKQKIKLVLSPKLILEGISPPIFGFAIMCFYYYSYFSLNSSLVWIRSCKSCELMSNFMKQYPISFTLLLHSNGMIILELDLFYSAYIWSLFKWGDNTWTKRSNLEFIPTICKTQDCSNLKKKLYKYENLL
jgi:hypothetical protein